MAESQLEENKIFKDILNNLYEAMFFVNSDCIIEFWNKAAERLTGYSSQEFVGKPCSENTLLQVDNNYKGTASLFTPVESTLKDAKPREMSLLIRTKNRRKMPVHISTIPIKSNDGHPIGVIVTIRDQSSESEIDERVKELKQLTFLDALTNIGNRRFADITLKEKLEHFNRHRWIFGVILFDIDNFKSINDHLGHNFGDYVLKTAAETFSTNIRTPESSVFRWGGDEFLLVNVNVDEHHLITIAERLRNCVKNTVFTHKSGVIRITISGGAALISDNDNVESIISRADQALYTSKQTGGNRCFLLREQTSK